jgi:hypothetical protein
VVKKKIGDTEYNVIPVPPYASGLFKKAADLIQKLVKEDDKSTREKAKVLMLEVFRETVEPEPQREHYLQLWNLLVEVTNAAVEDAQFFRKQQGSGVGEGGTAGVGTAQTPKRNSAVKG